MTLAVPLVRSAAKGSGSEAVRTSSSGGPFLDPVGFWSAKARVSGAIVFCDNTAGETASAGSWLVRTDCAATTTNFPSVAVGGAVISAVIVQAAALKAVPSLTLKPMVA